MLLASLPIGAQGRNRTTDTVIFSHVTVNKRGSLRTTLNVIFPCIKVLFGSPWFGDVRFHPDILCPLCVPDA